MFFLETRKFFGTYSSIKLYSIIGFVFVILNSIVSKVSASKIILHCVCSAKWQLSDRGEEV